MPQTLILVGLFIGSCGVGIWSYSAIRYIKSK